METTDATACGRNYFDRASGPLVDPEEEDCGAVLADAAALKKLAVDYMHPEIGVKTTDGTATAVLL